MRDFLLDENSPTLTEYGLLILLIAIAAIAGVTLLGTKAAGLFTNASSTYPP